MKKSILILLLVCILTVLVSLIIIFKNCSPFSGEAVSESIETESEKTKETEVQTSEALSDNTHDESDSEDVTSEAITSEESVLEETSEEEASEEKTEEAIRETEENTSEAEDTLTKFFGLSTEPSIAKFNQKTLEQPESMLKDVLAVESVKVSEVLEDILSYSLPDKAYYGDEPVTEDIRSYLLSLRNTEYLEYLLSQDQEACLELSYGVLIDNTDLRSFPTYLKASDSTEASSFDYFQETGLSYGMPVLVLHSSSDGYWSFIQSYYYCGWAETAKIGFCSREVFLDYASPEEFAVVTCENMTSSWMTLRVGTILAVTAHIDDNTVTLRLPYRTDDGYLMYGEENVFLSTGYSLGFLEYSEQAVISLMESMLGTAYGWGDSGNLYDCSSSVGAVYRCFGIWLPRNTSIMKYAVSGEVDASAMSSEEKLELMEAHPGCLIVIPGHVMLYGGTDESGLHRMLHNTSGYYDTEGNYVSVMQLVDVTLESMFRADGTSFLEIIQTFVYIPQDVSK